MQQTFINIDLKIKTAETITQFKSNTQYSISNPTLYKVFMEQFERFEINKLINILIKILVNKYIDNKYLSNVSSDIFISTQGCFSVGSRALQSYRVNPSSRS